MTTSKWLTAMETTESLTQKLLAAYGAMHQLERLRKRALPAWVRVVERSAEALPLGMIPITLVWTAIVFFLPFGEPLTLIRLYALGLLAMLTGAGVLSVLRGICSRIKLADAVLGELALIPGLAFHPNTVLRRSVAARGCVTLGEFLGWYQKQRDILETRVGDFEAAIATLQRGPVEPKEIAQLPPGARAFLES